MKIVLLGAPGSGKGTVAERLEKDFNLKHISAGELLREEVRKDTPIGRDIKKIIDKGNLVPDQFVVELIKLGVKDKNDYILDGFPRSLQQAEAIDDLNINLVIYLEVSEDLVVERLSGRRICEKGEHNYHIKYIPPKKKDICDVDGTKLIRRKDDDPEVVKEMYKIYHRTTEPLVKYYKEKDLLKTVDAAPLPKEVYQAVKKIVEENK